MDLWGIDLRGEDVRYCVRDFALVLVVMATLGLKYVSMESLVLSWSHDIRSWPSRLNNEPRFNECGIYWHYGAMCFEEIFIIRGVCTMYLPTCKMSVSLLIVNIISCLLSRCYSKEELLSMENVHAISWKIFLSTHSLLTKNVKWLIERITISRHLLNYLL